MEHEHELSKLEILIEDAIKKCQTSAHRVKAMAGYLRFNGMNGKVMGDMIKESEQVLKFAHLFQAYINFENLDGEK